MNGQRYTESIHSRATETELTRIITGHLITLLHDHWFKTGNTAPKVVPLPFVPITL